MSSFGRKTDDRRAVYLNLAGQIEGQIRQAYAKRHAQKRETQASIAKKIGVDKSAINRRLAGRTNMTIETIADMVWALGYCINVELEDPEEEASNRVRVVPMRADTMLPEARVLAPPAAQASTSGTGVSTVYREERVGG